MRIATIACIAGLFCFSAPLARASTVSANLNLGGATSQPDHLTLGGAGAATCPMAQLQVKVKNFIGPFNLTGEVRHAFCDSNKRELWGKSRYCVGVDIPVGVDTFLFASYERYYHTNDDWAWCGVSFRIGG
jgi:hypothetical protein